MKVIVKEIKCIKPQERGFYSDGDEMWARLQGGNNKVLSPKSGKSTWQMVAGLPKYPNMSVTFDNTAKLEIWDDDSAIIGNVEKDDNELLATFSWFATDDTVEDERVTCEEGIDADGAIYEIRYTLQD